MNRIIVPVILDVGYEIETVKNPRSLIDWSVIFFTGPEQGAERSKDGAPGGSQDRIPEAARGGGSWRQEQRLGVGVAAEGLGRRLVRPQTEQLQVRFIGLLLQGDDSDPQRHFVDLMSTNFKTLMQTRIFTLYSGYTYCSARISQQSAS